MRDIRTCTVRLKIIGNEMIKTVGQSEPCMVSKVPIIFKRTRSYVSFVCVTRPPNDTHTQTEKPCMTEIYLHCLCAHYGLYIKRTRT
eukprot:COSAG05_NODE_444_length_9777_cov_20.852965_2_plen_87_part_00